MRPFMEIGERVFTPAGAGEVIDRNDSSGGILVRLDSMVKQWFSFEQVFGLLAENGGLA